MAKVTFEEMVQKTDEALHNSNMQNIVSVKKRADADIEMLIKNLEWWQAQLIKIVDFGTNGNMLDTETVAELYRARPPECK